MQIRPIHSGQHIIITFFGISAIIFLGLLIALCFVLMNALEPQNIEDRVRLILSREITQKQMQALKNNGLKIPDEEMAIRWRDEFTRINNLEFLSVSVKNPILDIFSPDQPTFVVQAIIRDPSNHVTTRYFWLSWAGIDREISKIAWYFSI